MKLIIWTIGDLEKGIVPTKASIDYLKQQLEECKEDKHGVSHIIVGPEVKYTVIETEY